MCTVKLSDVIDPRPVECQNREGSSVTGRICVPTDLRRASSPAARQNPQICACFCDILNPYRTLSPHRG